MKKFYSWLLLMLVCQWVPVAHLLQDSNVQAWQLIAIYEVACGMMCYLAVMEICE